MTHTIAARSYLLFPGFLALALGCSAKQADTTPDIALSKSREGLPPEPTALGTGTHASGDTLICESSRRFRTANGDRWLWVRILVERAPGSETDKALAETVVSTDREGRQYDQNVELAGVSLDGENDYTLRNTIGVRTAETKEGPRQPHRARAYTIGPNMGPVETSCGGR